MTTLLCLHGSPGSAMAYEPLKAHVSARFTLHAIDFPDHGDAPDELQLDFAPFEKRVMDELEALRGERVIVVAYSLGAYITARLAHRLPQHVLGVVALAGFTHLSAEAITLRRTILQQLEAGTLTVEDMNRDLLGFFVGAHAKDPSYRAFYERFSKTWTKPRTIRTLQRCLHMGDAKAVKPYSVPLIAMHGVKDPAVAISGSEQLVSLGSKAKLIRVDTDAHDLILTQPKLVMQHIATLA
jgi:pimeloyl-ACP methyl ester carboxylesterase